MTSDDDRPSWMGVADAVGHCVLIFAFVPALMPIPSWIAFEATNPLNAHDPVVLGFVVVRGVNLLLDTFRAHVFPGVLAGAIAGAVTSAWVRSGGRAATVPERIALGALGGLVGTGVALTLPLVVQAFGEGGRPPWSGAPVALDILSGLVCGMIATPTAVGFLNASVARDVPLARGA